MKKQPFLIILSTFLLVGIVFAVFIMPLASAEPIQCKMTADDYATEVLLNRDYVDYNIDSLKNAENVSAYNGVYIFKSFYGNNLYTILSEQQNTHEENISSRKFLSVRLQIPLDKIDENVSYFRITSFRRFNVADLNANAAGWTKACNSADSCVFEKDDTSITIERNGNAFSGYIDFLNPNFKDCSDNICSGNCMRFSSEKKCIPKSIIEDINSFVLNIGIARNFDDFVMSRKTEQGTYSISRLVPQNSGAIKWEDAMKEELLWLRGHDMIHITERDMMEIAILSDAGRVKDNRVFYGINEAGSLAWTYRSNENSRIAADDDCSEFPLQTAGITGFIAFDTKLLSEAYILIPLIFIGFIAIVLLILFVAAKIVNKKNTVRIRRIVSE